MGSCMSDDINLPSWEEYAEGRGGERRGRPFADLRKQAIREAERDVYRKAAIGEGPLVAAKLAADARPPRRLPRRVPLTLGLIHQLEGPNGWGTDRWGRWRPEGIDPWQWVCAVAGACASPNYELGKALHQYILWTLAGWDTCPRTPRDVLLPHAIGHEIVTCLDSEDYPISRANRYGPMAGDVGRAVLQWVNKASDDTLVTAPLSKLRKTLRDVALREAEPADLALRNEAAGAVILPDRQAVAAAVRRYARSGFPRGEPAVRRALQYAGQVLRLG